MECLRSSCLAVAIWATFAVQGQMLLNAQTGLVIDSGTIVTIPAPVTWNISTNAALVNDGTIILLEGATLSEMPGSPITGVGKELTRIFSNAPLNQVEPGGLGFSLSTVSAPDTLLVERGHVAFLDDQAQPGVSRWYRLHSTSGATLSSTIIARYDDSELNGINESDLVLHQSDDDGNSWNWLPATLNTASNELASGMLNGSGMFTFFQDTLSVGLEDPTGAQILIGPNPTTALLILQCAQVKVEQISVHDLAGRSVSDRVAMRRLGPDSIEIDLGDLSAGTYLVRMNAKAMAKVIKE